MIDITYKYWKQRVRECKRCPHSQLWMGKLVTCGTFAVGDILNLDGKEVHLCGCIMQLKAKIERSKCPLDKWKDAVHTDNR